MTTDAVVPIATVREATETDAPRVVELAAAAVAALTGSRGAELMLQREAPAPNAATITEWIARDDAVVFLGQLDDVPIGTASAVVNVLASGTRLAVVEMLWVDEEARSMSVGEALLNALIAWGRDQRCVAIDAYALPGERITKNFFEAAGMKARLLTVSRRLDNGDDNNGDDDPT